jgi:hypothetical protein
MSTRGYVLSDAALRDQAEKLRRYLSDCLQIELPPTQSLEAVARANGFQDWNSAVAALALPNETPSGPIPPSEGINRQLVNLYKSDSGRLFNADDWLRLKSVIENYNEQLGDQLLKLRASDRLPVLTQPASLIIDQLRKGKSQTATRAANAISEFDFIFQIVRQSEFKNAGPTILKMLESALAPYELHLGMDLGEYQGYLNQFSLSEFLRQEGHGGYEGHHIPFLTYSPDTDKYSYTFFFEPELKLEARFHLQMWNVQINDIKISASTKRELFEELEFRYYQRWAARPESITVDPLVAIVRSWLENIDLGSSGFRKEILWRKDSSVQLPSWF